MNKGLTILLSGLAATTLLAGCGAKTSTTKKPVDHDRTAKATAPAKHHETPTAEAELTPTTLVASGPATLQLTRAQVVLPAVKGQFTNPTPASRTAAKAVTTPAKPTAAVTTATAQFPVAQLKADQLTQQQEFGLYAWYTSHYVTGEVPPVAARGLTVTALAPTAQTAALPAGTNNTYYLVYGATPDNGEWVNYYAKGSANQGATAPVYIYNRNQWNPYNVNQMVTTANQNNGAGYVNRIANQVHFYDER